MIIITNIVWIASSKLTRAILLVYWLANSMFKRRRHFALARSLLRSASAVDGPFGPHGPLGQGGLLTQPSAGMGPLGISPLGQRGLLTQPGAGIWRRPNIKI
jgi:hypothetical protein